MRNRRIRPFIVPIAAFIAVGIVYAIARGTLTTKSLIIGLIAAAVIVFAATQIDRGPYI
jgi:multisubunit Na+/H+ antiporter MnhE subunit